MTPKPVWTFETFHTAACRLHLQDPGARCICRPPMVDEPHAIPAPLMQRALTEGRGLELVRHLVALRRDGGDV